MSGKDLGVAVPGPAENTAPQLPAAGVVTPQHSATYYPHIDGLRAVAVLAVMLYHLHPSLLPGGFVGVDVFFVISGFVVAASLDGHGRERLGEFLARFYARRLARLMPALIVVLLVTTVLYVMFVPRAWFNRAADTTLLGAFWGLSNFVLDAAVINYFEPRAELNPFTHTWSLGVEEQFYLMAPLLLYAALGVRQGERRGRGTLALAAIALLAVASLAACLWFGMTRGSRYVFYLLVFRFWELAAGVLLYALGRRVAALRGMAARAYAASGWLGAGLVVLALAAPGTTAYPFLRALVAVVGTVLLVGLPGVPRSNALLGGLASRPAVWVGLRSYSLYLWHWPLYVLARWTVGLGTWATVATALALSFALAAASYRFIESPVRRSATLLRLPPGLRVALFVAAVGAGWAAATALLALQPTLGRGQPTREAPDWYADRGLLRTERAAARACEPRVETASVAGSPRALTLFQPISCPAPAAARLFVIGDSHATAYLPLLEQLSAEQGREVAVIQVPGCAFLDMMAPMDAAQDRRCHEVAQAAVAAVLARAQPGDVVLLTSLRLPRLVELGGRRRATAPGQGPYERSPAEQQAIAQAEQDAPRWLLPLTRAGLKVVIELPKPVYRAHPFQCVDAFNRSNPECAPGLSERRVDIERYRAPTVQALQRLSAAVPGVTLWDPLPLLCAGDGDRCGAMRDGRPLYFDADHLSPYGNLVLLPAIGAMLAL